MSSAGPRDTTAFEVREALAEAGCAVCRLSLRSVSRAIRSIAYEQVNDVGLRQQLRRGGGFCNTHAYAWLRQSATVLGTALIYRDVLNASLGDLEGGGVVANDRRGGRLRGLLGGGKSAVGCPLCQAQSEAEGRYLESLMAVVSADASVLDGSDALCRRHALAAIRAGGAASEPVVRRCRETVEQMLAELDEVIRKEDYRFRDEERTEAERTVPTRAIAWAAGAEGLAGE